MPTAVRRPRRNSFSAASFRRSSNIERDRDIHTVTDGFIVTACARRTLRRLLNGLSRHSQQRAWTLTGPYGTGKSSFCLFAASVFGPGNSQATRRARELVATVDEEVAASIEGEFGSSRGMVTVLVTGNREPIQVAIARGCAGALRTIRKTASTRLATELESVTASAPANFLNLLDRSIRCLVHETSGAQGCLIVLDEMGKLLEFAAANPEHSDVYLLQQLSEMASTPDSLLSVLGVLHQDFSGYAKSLLPTHQHEWEKVRGRFEDIVFEQSAEDMIRLIAEAMGRDREASIDFALPDRSVCRQLCQDVLSLGVLASGKGQDHARTTLQKCLPLHPAVALLLGPVFKRFGQNERSAFSFLRSAEPFGLPDFVARQKVPSLYRLVDLYHYLTGVFGDALLAGRDGRRWAEAFNVETQHPGLSSAESDVLRTIALLTIVGRWHGLPATIDAINLSVSPRLERTETEAALQSLQQKSAIVYRKFNKSYSLWEGSDIDVEAKVAEVRAGQAGDTPTTHLLRGVFVPRPLVARRHSFERGTLRYFDIIPVSPTLPGEVTDAIARSTADGHLLVLLHDLGDPRKLSDEIVRLLTASSNVVLCVPATAREVDSFARELAAIDAVERSVRELQNDQTALRELAARKDEVRRGLDQSLADLMTPSKPGARSTRWIRCGSDLRIRSHRELNERLSAICDELFPDCPTIQNEIINRRLLVAALARVVRTTMSEDANVHLLSEVSA